MNPNATASARNAIAMTTPLSEASLAKASASGLLPAAGELAAEKLSRLAASVLSIDGLASWQLAPQASARTGSGSSRRYWLTVKANVTCSCERCLAPVSMTIASRRGFEFFASEGLLERRAAQLEELAESDPDAQNVDLLLDEDGLTLLGLIEDELLLELPMAPKHETCPLPA